MKTTNPPFPLVYSRSLLLIAAGMMSLAQPAHAQWMGVGVTGGTGGTDFNTPSNWVADGINGDFTLNNSTADIVLSGNAAVSSMDFRWATGGINLSIGGSGTISLGGDMYLPNASGANTVTIGSGVTLNLGSFSSARTFNDSTTGRGQLVVNGLITGTATGGGQMIFGGHQNYTATLNNTANSFDAPIVLAGGNLKFTSIGNVGAGPSALGSASTIASGTITLQRNALLNYVGSTNQSSDRSLVFNAGAGPVGLYHEGTGGNLTYSSDMALGSYVGSFRVRALEAGATITLLGKISNTAGGAANLEANYGGGVGTIVLQNTGNDYLGKTIVSRGVLEVTKLANGGVVSSIGASSNSADNLAFGDYGNGRGTLRYVGAGDSTDRLFTMPRLGAIIESSGTGALHFTNTGFVSTGTGYSGVVHELTLGGTNTDQNSFASLLADHVASSVTSSSRVSKTGAGTWNLTGTASTYTGATLVQAGVLGVSKFANGGSTSSIGASSNAASNLIIYNGSTVRYTGTGDTTDRLFQISNTSGHDQTATLDASGTGAISFTNIGNLTYGSLNQRRTLFLTGTNTGNNTLAATITNNNSTTGAVSITKEGTGKWILTGNNTYTGATRVNAGTLIINGSTDAGSAVTVASGATLGGSGVINGTVTVNGSLAPGNSLGTLTINNTVTWNGLAGQAWKFELGAVSGSSDFLSISGGFQKGTGSNFSFDFLGTGVQGTFILVEWGGSTSFLASDFTYGNLGSGLSGTFSVVGNQLQMEVIPEPSTCLLAGLGLSLLLFSRRRRLQQI
jgi:fibronectin-binding autotransporter adhesin